MNYTSYIVNDEVRGLGGNGCKVHGVGTVELEDAEGTKNTLHNVLHVPDAQRPLLSLAKLMRDDEFTIHITQPNDPSNFRLMSSKSGINLPGRTINDLFHIWELESHQYALITTRAMTKRRHDDDDGKAGKGEKGSENFTQEKHALQPIRGRESTPQPRLTNNDAQTSIGDPSSSSSHDPQSIPTNNAIIEDEIDEEIDPQSRGFDFWHRRLGHTSYRNLLKLGLIPRRDKRTSLQSCDACALEKQTRLPYHKYEHKAPRRLWRVHSDMSGEQQPDIGEGFKYFITFIDDYSRYCWVYFTKRKDAATIRSIYEQWQRDAVNKANKPVSFLMTDGGGEYQAEMANILNDSGTTHLKSPPYTPESNGLAERQNRTLKDTARTIMKQANMPSSFWPKAVKAACDIRNCLPHSSLKGIRSPHRAFFKQEPSLERFKIFGSIVYAHVPKERRPKQSTWNDRAVLGAIVGYPSDTTYEFYDFSKRQFMTTHDLTIREGQFATYQDFDPTSPTSPTNQSPPRPGSPPAPKPIYDMIVVQP